MNWDDVLGDGCVRHGDDFVNAEEALADAALRTKVGTPMVTCVVCHFAMLEDDIAILGTSGHGCICVGCWHRVVETEHPLPKKLREDLSRTVNQAPTT